MFPITDIDECITNNGGCDVNAACTNTIGSRTCQCNSGWTGNGLTCTGDMRNLYYTFILSKYEYWLRPYD